MIYVLREQARSSQNCHQIGILTGQKFAKIVDSKSKCETNKMHEKIKFIAQKKT